MIAKTKKGKAVKSPPASTLYARGVFDPVQGTSTITEIGKQYRAAAVELLAQCKTALSYAERMDRDEWDFLKLLVERGLESPSIATDLQGARELVTRVLSHGRSKVDHLDLGNDQPLARGMNLADAELVDQVRKVYDENTAAIGRGNDHRSCQSIFQASWPLSEELRSEARRIIEVFGELSPDSAATGSSSLTDEELLTQCKALHAMRKLPRAFPLDQDELRLLDDLKSNKFKRFSGPSYAIALDRERAKGVVEKATAAMGRAPASIREEEPVAPSRRNGHLKELTPATARILPPLPAAAAVPAWGPLQDVDLKLLDRHPINRVPTDADVAERMASIQKDGQLEPLRIRTMPKGRFQILSGETRVLAGRKLGLQKMEARAIACDDAQALIFLADFNGHRTDLNPIQKARLILKLCEPREKGGSGLSREEAAGKVGIESVGGASNLVRLLELPQVWQDRIESGELPQSFARLLLPYVQAPKIMAAIDKDWLRSHKPNADQDDLASWESRTQLERLLQQIFEDETRPVDGKTKVHYEYSQVGFWAMQPRLFDLTDDVRAKLEVQKFEIDGKTIEMATNAKAFDKLNIPLVKKQHEQESKQSARGSSKETKAKPQRLTTAEVKKRAEKAAKQFRDRIGNWRHAWLGRLVGEQIDKRQDIQLILLCWLAADGMPSYNASHLELAKLANSTAAKFGATKASSDWCGVDKSALLRTLIQVPKTEDLQEIARQMALATLTKEERDPRYTRIDHDRMDALASRCGIDVATAWQQLQRKQSPELEIFYELHNQSQLEELASELGVSLDGCKGKDAKVTKMLDNEGLKLPKCLKPLTAKKGK